MSNVAPSVHKAVLLHEVTQAFGLQVQSRKSGAASRDFIYLDGTLGGAGHALAVADALRGKVTLIGLDRDLQAIERAKNILEGKVQKLVLENEDFRNLDKVLQKHNVVGVDAILFDLGLSSDELASSGRGFSFQKDEPLLMTFNDPNQAPFTARDVVNGWKEESIANVIYAYGGERYARRIAKAIILARQKKPIETSTELAEIVRYSVPASYRRGRIHPATRTFQALRIVVNDELGALKDGLIKGWQALNPGGRMAVISFHSLEDRIVKEFFKEKKISKEGKIENKKPIVASKEEVQENPRSRSAKLRIIEKQI
ncbi:MAG: 16S rRNA (cytosine(1402)-N(4))-methyltransferase RsmH [Patescibacteria group bacterium]|nr:16S rRNA (cytosine(1402)-N(4))-methyltransferase RsmH [Patescibacteria group bacterium]